MKKIFFLLSIPLFASLASSAQCGKSTVLTSSKTEYLDPSMTVQRTEDEASTVELSDSALTITTGPDAHAMNGTITSKTCAWTVPYKEGKSVVNATLTDESGDVKHLTLTIEGKGGKVTLLASVDEMPDQKIRVAADAYTEKK